jgi:rod shape-determining protein MreB
MKSILGRRSSVAIDLGNNNTIVTDKGNNPYSQPSFIVFNEKNQSVKAVGKEAYEMSGRTHQDLKVVKPMKGGVIKDFNSASMMLQQLVSNAYPGKTFFRSFDHIICGVPFTTTEVERRALRDVLSQFSAANIYLLFEPIAAAIGLGMDIKAPEGRFIVDIGGGITEAVVISLSGIVTSGSSRIAGDAFDLEIQEYIRKHHKLDISLSIAERAKICSGAACGLEQDIPESYYVVGKDTITGIPKGIWIDHLEIAEILDSSINKIEQLILQILEECPPELASDIYDSGITITGGGSLLRGMKERLQTRIKLPVNADEDALLSVSRGISAVLKNPENYRTVLFS